MKPKLIPFLCLITMFNCGAMADSMKETEKEQLVSTYSYWKSIGEGLGQNAVKSPFGRYLLLKDETSTLALKLEKHLPTQKGKGAGQAARYSWVLLIDGKQKDSGSFDIDEEKGKGSAIIEIGGFNCEWSFGDWVYFDSKLPNMEMAKTEATEKKELNSLESLTWWSKSSLNSYINGNFSKNKLREAMGLEQ